MYIKKENLTPCNRFTIRIYTYIHTYLYVCVCVRERERERGGGMRIQMVDKVHVEVNLGKLRWVVLKKFTLNSGLG